MRRCGFSAVWFLQAVVADRESCLEGGGVAWRGGGEVADSRRGFADRIAWTRRRGELFFWKVSASEPSCRLRWRLLARQAGGLRGQRMSVVGL